MDSVQPNRTLKLLVDFSFKFSSTKTNHISNTFSHKLSSIHNERKSKQMISDDEVEKRTPFIHFSSYLSIHVFHIHISETRQRRVLLLVKNIINIFLPLEKESWLQKCHLKYEIYEIILMQDWRSGSMIHLLIDSFYFSNNKKLYSSTSKLSKKSVWKCSWKVLSCKNKNVSKAYPCEFRLHSTAHLHDKSIAQILNLMHFSKNKVAKKCTRSI